MILKMIGVFSVGLALLFLNVGKAAGGVQSPPTRAACSASQLSLALDDEDGYFSGMSQSGTLLVLRNLGPETCKIPARPTIGFEDAGRRPLRILLESPAGTRPGPVLLPVAVPVEAEVTSQLRWVSGDVYDGHNCVSPAFLTVAVGMEVLRVALTGRRFCGAAGKAPSYSMTPLKRDPVYAAPAR